MFSADDITPHLLTGRMTECRRVVAQIAKPDLCAALRVRQLAVCGVLCCPDGIVFGRREASAVYLAGVWQLPPAGCVDAAAVRGDGSIDLEGQLLGELDEELGLASDAVEELRPLCAVEHPDSHIMDLGFLIRTTPPGPAITAAHARRGNGEYDLVQVVPWSNLRTRITRLGSSPVPAARAFLRRSGIVAERD